MKLRYPIQHNYMWHARSVMVNQLFGDNKNRFFYGASGHSGIDFKTKGSWEYKRVSDGFDDLDRDTFELAGRIPIVAAHDGVVSLVLNENKQGLGWGLYVTADPVIEDGVQVQYRTLYWHIETPWRSLSPFKGVVKTIQELKDLHQGRRVRKGAIIAVSGDNGKSTGAHLHFSLDRRVKYTNWTSWERINPMPYFDHHDAVVHATYVHDADIVDNSKLGTGAYQGAWFYQGKQVSESEAKRIISSLSGS